MANTILQVPLDKQLRDKAALMSEQLGFSSLQEAVRIFLNKMAKGQMDIQFEEPAVQLSARAIKRYNKISDDIEVGRNITGPFTDVDEMMKYLHEGKIPR